MYVQSAVNMRHSAPPPVIIETGEVYEYKNIESAIYVPSHWEASCYNQEQLVYYMVLHFNNFRNGMTKMKPDTMDTIARKWVCLTEPERE